MKLKVIIALLEGKIEDQIKDPPFVKVHVHLQKIIQILIQTEKRSKCAAGDKLRLLPEVEFQNLTLE